MPTLKAHAAEVMDGAHTPGPWTAKRALTPTDGEFDWGVGAEISGRRHCIAETFGRVALDVRPNAEANAHLIAAAPDMLAALKALDDWWTADFPNGPDGHGEILSDETRAIWRQIRAARSKAEGRS